MPVSKSSRCIHLEHIVHMTAPRRNGTARTRIIPDNPSSHLGVARLRIASIETGLMYFKQHLSLNKPQCANLIG